MKKFLTVLLALSVVFTYSFSAVGTAFAAASTSEEEAVTAFTKVVEDVKNDLAYDGYGYMKTTDGVTGVISKTVVEEEINKMVDTYTTAISNVTSNWDSEWSAVDTVAKFEGVLFDNDGTNNTYAKLLTAQFAIDKAAAEEALDVDVKGYTDTAKQAIDTKITALKATLANIESTFKAATTAADKATEIKNIRTQIVKDIADFLKTQPTVTDNASKITEAKRAALKNLNAKADAFIDAVKAATATTGVEVSRQKTVVSDVAKLVTFFEDKIEEVATADNATAVAVDAVTTVINATFATTSTPIFNAEFFNDLDTYSNIGLLNAYAKDVADTMKAERKADGTFKYAVKDVDKAYDAAIAAVKAAAYADISAGTTTLNKAVVDTEMAKVVVQGYPLKDYKKAQIDYITGAVVAGGNQDATYDATNWSGERKAKVAEIQTKAKEDILLAETVADVDAVVKKATADMGALLTDAEIAALNAKTDARITAQGYDDAFDKYFDAVVGTKGYSTKTKTDAINNAKQVLKDAVIAQEDPELTKAEIDKIIKENYNNAIAALVDVKTDAERAEAAKAVDALIAALPKTVELTDKDSVLAAQKAYDEYLELPGANKIDVKNRLTLDKALGDLIDLETTAVRNQIRALPEKVTVNDAAAIEAARAALDALEATYGDYGAVAPANASKLVAAEKALEAAKLADAIDKVAALGANPTKEAVEAARKAYDALSTESRLEFNDELYADLLNAEKAVGGYEKVAIQGTHMKIYSSAAKGYIKISWKASNSDVALDGVEVYRSTKKTSGFKKVSTFKKQTSKKYTTKLNKGTKYYYYVKGYKMVGDEKVYTHKSITVARTFRK